MFKKLWSKVKKFFTVEQEQEKTETIESERYEDIVRTSIFDSVIAQLNEKANSPKEEQEQTENKIEHTSYSPKVWTWKEWKEYNKEQRELFDKIRQTKLA
ncbi:hypothetical protein F400_gp140 [Bacillus phage BCD7]|uniref:Uncharacterized protein n=1 Tax=Bacillus phage BCD7 TaxID=1136534 RepID=J9PUE8_9CAUD|nr:hypothetical protein F400_gp140 [Bacillus phage BCD7]AEZ50587.1 hypothetical protein BCD7_0140 [Bacillus phage BCD7]